MKKIGMVLLMCLLAGCAQDSLTEPLNFTDEAVIVTIADADQTQEVILPEAETKEFLIEMENMTPTSLQSIQDIPAQEIEHVVTIKGEKTQIFYFYSENGKYYAEQPYNGIYECTQEFYDSLKDRESVKMAIMIDGVLYQCTEEVITEARCGVMDGMITSEVSRNQMPTIDDQSNFGTGYEYQLAGENCIDVVMDGKWIRFERQMENCKKQ